MHWDTGWFTAGCPHCAVVSGGSCQHQPSLYPIPICRPFQIVEVDTMELPTMDAWEKLLHPYIPGLLHQVAHGLLHVYSLIALLDYSVLVYWSHSSVWSSRITSVRLRHELVITPDDRYVPTSWHTETKHYFPPPTMQQDGGPKLWRPCWKYAVNFSTQWDRYLPGALWTYHNVPHDSTRKESSFLLYSLNCHSPTEAVFLLTHAIKQPEVSDFERI